MTNHGWADLFGVDGGAAMGVVRGASNGGGAVMGWLAPGEAVDVETFAVGAGGSLQGSMVDAFGAAYARAEALVGPERPAVWVANGTVREALLECAASFPRVALLTSSPLLPRDLHNAVYDVARSLPAQDLPAPRKRVVATDASRGARGGCGLAFISDDGEHNAWFRDRIKDVSMAELLAIRAAIKRFPHDDLTVITDSQHAADWIDGRRAPDNWEVHTIVDGIRAARAERRVSVQWVRGHSGHRMNEIADRLARGVRRAVQGEITDTQWDVIRCGIIAEFEDSATKVSAA